MMIVAIAHTTSRHTTSTTTTGTAIAALFILLVIMVTVGMVTCSVLSRVTTVTVCGSASCSGIVIGNTLLQNCPTSYIQQLRREPLDYSVKTQDTTAQ